MLPCRLVAGRQGRQSFCCLVTRGVQPSLLVERACVTRFQPFRGLGERRFDFALGRQRLDDGRRVRICRKCKGVIDK